MATGFHSLRVKKIIRETSDCVSVTFEIPLDLSTAFQYKEGQYITIKKTIDGHEVRRSYSICKAPHENSVTIAVKKVDGGLFSTYATEVLKENDLLDVMPPMGKFIARVNNDPQSHYLAIAAGSGITPVIAIIKHTLHTQPDSKVTLVYGNRSRHSIIFFEELEELKNRFMNRFNLIHILSREKTDAEIFHGKIDSQKLTALQAVIDYAKMKSVYLCGPESMIFNASDFLKSQGVQEENIHFELFTSSTGNASAKTNVEESNDASPKSHVTIRLDGRTFSFDLSMKGNSILDAALQQGADLPFACKGGVCCTCRAKLLEGKVHMDVNYALEKEEVEQGFILTCQSHPLTENVFVDFDEK